MADEAPDAEEASVVGGSSSEASGQASEADGKATDAAAPGDEVESDNPLGGGLPAPGVLSEDELEDLLDGAHQAEDCG